MYDILYIDDTKIKYKDRTYNINIAFNRFLKAIDILEDKNLDETEKVIYIYECFIDDAYKVNINDKANIVNKIFENTNNFINDKKKIDNEVVMDIKQDFKYIYSSFYKDYGIDLMEQIDKLSWIKFVTLLGGLSKDTKMSEVIKIRTMPIPKPNKNNADEIKEILKLKAYYGLEQKEDNFQKQLDSLFSALKKIAKPKKKKKKPR